MFNDSFDDDYAPDDWEEDQWEDDNVWYANPSGDDAETLPCPECGADVYEDAEQCPVCGQYITHSTSVWAGRSPWWIVLGAAGAIAVILTLAF